MALHGLDIQVFRDTAQSVRILLNNDYILVFQGEAAGNVETNLTCANNNNLQRNPSERS
jgi:hypothetical protein